MDPGSQISPRSSRVNEAFAAIRSMIEERQLLPGEPLRLEALSTQLSMSMTPVREAIRLLESEGLVERYPNRGAVVAKVADTDIIELSLIRATIEPLAVALATVRATDEQIEAIRAAHDQLVERVRQKVTPSRTAPSVADWHTQIYDCAGSKHISDTIARVWTGIRINSLWHDWRADHSMDEHEEIMKHIEARDPRAAAEAMRQHLVSGISSHMAGRAQSFMDPESDPVAEFTYLLDQV